MTVPVVGLVVGARPQFVKAAALFRAHRDGLGDPAFDLRLIHTGQHFDPAMNQAFFDELEIPPPFRQFWCGGGSHHEQTAKMLTAVGDYLADERPDFLLVLGDTNTTIAAALAAAKLHIPVGHVEAGLRSGDRAMPEEINRIVVDHLADLNYVANRSGAALLTSEGIDNAVVVGDVMRDVFDAASSSSPGVTPNRAPSRASVLVTIHRPSNTDDPERLSALLDSLGRLASEGVGLLWPVHPRLDLSSADLPAGVEICSPLPYGEMVARLCASDAVITDSGGLQKEAYWAGVPCVTVRSSTEWVETVAEGWNRLVAPAEVAASVRGVIGGADRPAGAPDAYGPVGASGRILDSVGAHLAARY